MQNKFKVDINNVSVKKSHEKISNSFFKEIDTAVDVSLSEIRALHKKGKINV